MKVYTEDRIIYLKNRAGQEICIEYDAEGDACREEFEDAPPYDWLGSYVENLRITRISLWVGRCSREFRLSLESLEKNIGSSLTEYFKGNADLALQEKLN